MEIATKAGMVGIAAGGKALEPPHAYNQAPAGIPCRRFFFITGTSLCPVGPHKTGQDVLARVVELVVDGFGVVGEGGMELRVLAEIGEFLHVDLLLDLF
jgi:hypothetical protein